jgi:hypothetical protein
MRCVRKRTLIAASIVVSTLPIAIVPTAAQSRAACDRTCVTAVRIRHVSLRDADTRSPLRCPRSRTRHRVRVCVLRQRRRRRPQRHAQRRLKSRLRAEHSLDVADRGVLQDREGPYRSSRISAASGPLRRGLGLELVGRRDVEPATLVIAESCESARYCSRESGCSCAGSRCVDVSDDRHEEPR